MTTHQADACRVVRTQGSYHGKQGFDYAAAISAQSVGARAVCMHLLTMPPGARANTHLHQNHETALYVLSGASGMWYGERLEHHLEAQAGNFLYIGAGVPHLPYNFSQTQPCTAVLARTDSNEQESVVLRPDLDALRE